MIEEDELKGGRKHAAGSWLSSCGSEPRGEYGLAVSNGVIGVVASIMPGTQ